MSKIERFFYEMKFRKIAFIGVGVTNTDLIKLFLKKGIQVTICDRKDPDKMGDVYNQLKALAQNSVWATLIWILLLILTLFSDRPECISTIRSLQMQEKRV